MVEPAPPQRLPRSTPASPDPLRGAVVQLIVDGEDSDAAQLMLFYRFRRTPPLQILTTLHKERSPDGTVMSFSSDDGMPLAAMLRFEAAPDARSGAAATTVSLVLQYALPNVLVEYIGKFGVEMHVNEILKQNLEVCVAAPPAARSAHRVTPSACEPALPPLAHALVWREGQESCSVRHCRTDVVIGFFFHDHGHGHVDGAGLCSSVGGWVR